VSPASAPTNGPAKDPSDRRRVRFLQTEGIGCRIPPCPNVRPFRHNVGGFDYPASAVRIFCVARPRGG
jgi:hypothetical protein